MRKGGLALLVRYHGAAEPMPIETILIILLVLLLLGVLPTWPYSRGWGYYPSSAVLVLLILFFLMFFVFAGPVRAAERHVPPGAVLRSTRTCVCQTMRYRPKPRPIIQYACPPARYMQPTNDSPFTFGLGY